MEKKDMKQHITLVSRWHIGFGILGVIGRIGLFTYKPWAVSL